ncbi:predicted protein [Phaeodactylum tricornutum CCAP 1055/1]|uniref:Uncharacterized protein n=1 Tax=Phaeodactylum tricornutum (strain CCAP 1055/1) TaxID=556484 RepID=B5Y3J2_PHATC|nr:predicted protein [Phaeodactylum tricornutum CCAP 1055/1]ACI65136.1 predicted protein [Phaeodactylum tricornutum CCAP 1055/1]|eukprot:XP_002185666.1 predicted protein [Phaeodactylum tricornutum CCAP 1055/1]
MLSTTNESTKQRSWWSRYTFKMHPIHQLVLLAVGRILVHRDSVVLGVNAYARASAPPTYRSGPPPAPVSASSFTYTPQSTNPRIELLLDRTVLLYDRASSQQRQSYEWMIDQLTSLIVYLGQLLSTQSMAQSAGPTAQQMALQIENALLRDMDEEPIESLVESLGSLRQTSRDLPYRDISSELQAVELQIQAFQRVLVSTQPLPDTGDTPSWFREYSGQGRGMADMGGTQTLVDGNANRDKQWSDIIRVGMQIEEASQRGVDPSTIESLVDAYWRGDEKQIDTLFETMEQEVEAAERRRPAKFVVPASVSAVAKQIEDALLMEGDSDPIEALLKANRQKTASVSSLSESATIEVPESDVAAAPATTPGNLTGAPQLTTDIKAKPGFLVATKENANTQFDAQSDELNVFVEKYYDSKYDFTKADPKDSVKMIGLALEEAMEKGYDYDQIRALVEAYAVAKQLNCREEERKATTLKEYAPTSIAPGTLSQPKGQAKRAIYSPFEDLIRQTQQYLGAGGNSQSIVNKATGQAPATVRSKSLFPSFFGSSQVPSRNFKDRKVSVPNGIISTSLSPKPKEDGASRTTIQAPREGKKASFDARTMLGIKPATNSRRVKPVSEESYAVQQFRIEVEKAERAMRTARINKPRMSKEEEDRRRAADRRRRRRQRASPFYFAEVSSTETAPPGRRSGPGVRGQKSNRNNPEVIQYARRMKEIMRARQRDANQRAQRKLMEKRVEERKKLEQMQQFSSDISWTVKQGMGTIEDFVVSSGAFIQKVMNTPKEVNALLEQKRGISQSMRPPKFATTIGPSNIRTQDPSPYFFAEVVGIERSTTEQIAEAVFRAIRLKDAVVDVAVKSGPILKNGAELNLWAWKQLSEALDKINQGEPIIPKRRKNLGTDENIDQAAPTEGTQAVNLHGEPWSNLAREWDERNTDSDDHFPLDPAPPVTQPPLPKFDVAPMESQEWAASESNRDPVLSNGVHSTSYRDAATDTGEWGWLAGPWANSELAGNQEGGGQQVDVTYNDLAKEWAARNSDENFDAPFGRSSSVLAPDSMGNRDANGRNAKYSDSRKPSTSSYLGDLMECTTEEEIVQMWGQVYRVEYIQRRANYVAEKSFPESIDESDDFCADAVCSPESLRELDSATNGDSSCQAGAASAEEVDFTTNASVRAPQQPLWKNLANEWLTMNQDSAEKQIDVYTQREKGRNEELSPSGSKSGSGHQGSALTYIETPWQELAEEWNSINNDSSSL